jgi:hypothetical protein
MIRTGSHAVVRAMRLEERRRIGQTWATSGYDLGGNEVGIADRPQPVGEAPAGPHRLEDPAVCRRLATGPVDGRV